MSSFSQYFGAANTVLGVTLLAFLVQPFVGHRTVGLIYLVGVVVLGLFVGRGPTLLAAAMSALAWDFFFLAPIPNLRIANAEDAMMFAVYFVVAIVLGQLTARIRAQEKAESRREKRATALYHLTREMVEATSRDQMLRQAVQRMERIFAARIVVLLPDAGGRLSFHPHPASSYDLPGPEQPVAEMVFESRGPAGMFTDRCKEVEALYLPLVTGATAVGVLGLNFVHAHPPVREHRNLLDAFCQQLALALDRNRLREEAEQARRLADSERLSKALLNSMSHEMRTPIAAIKGATGNLVEFGEAGLSPSQCAMIGEIQEATERLNRLVGNVLEISRLESGLVKPRLELCDVRDLVQVVVKDTRSALAAHKLTVQLAPELPLVRLDFVLTQQALTNLLSNAGFHTPPGTPVQLTARVHESALLLAVADRGPGVPPESLPRIFEKFFRAPGARAGGTGLGLSLVKGFAEAQGGGVTAENRSGGGAAFTIRLPLGDSTKLPDEAEHEADPR